jgi:hypothetical protein
MPPWWSSRLQSARVLKLLDAAGEVGIALKMGWGGALCQLLVSNARIIQSPEGASVIKAACLHKNRERTLDDLKHSMTLLRHARLQICQRFVLRGPGATGFQFRTLKKSLFFLSTSLYITKSYRRLRKFKWSTIWLVFRKLLVRISARITVIATEDFGAVLQSCQINDRKVV